MANGVKTQIVVDRLREPSTWAGIAALAAMFGVNIEVANAVVQAIVGIAGIAAIVLKEGK